MTVGYRTSEFWLSLAVTVVGLIVASGIIPTGSIWAQIAGLVLSTTSSMGYTVSRGIVKSNQ